MSYDLFYDTGDTPLQTISEYFDNHPLYVKNADEGMYVYENEETGVYFYFYLSEENGKADLSFNLNYNRPCIFAEEAALELREFHSAFRFPINDPQMNGHDDSTEFSEELFKRGWNSGNKFAFEAVKNHSEEALNQFLTMDKQKLIDGWHWNLIRNGIYDQIDKDLYISKMFFLIWQGRAVTCGFWPDAIPSLIPYADYVMIPRREMNGGEEDMCIIPFEDMQKAMADYIIESDKYIAFKDEEAPRNVQLYVQSLSPAEDQPEILPMERVVEEGVL